MSRRSSLQVTNGNHIKTLGEPYYGSPSCESEEMFLWQESKYITTRVGKDMHWIKSFSIWTWVNRPINLCEFL